MTRVLSTSLMLAALLAGAVAGAQTPDASKAPTPAAGKEVVASGHEHGRLLGIYNASSGDPVEGAEVWDLIAKTYVVTSSTGTVSLAFVQSQHDSAAIWIRKLGFQDTTFIVKTGKADTIPITFFLPKASELSVINTIADAVSLLPVAMRGFEERHAQGYGKFITPAELREQPDGRMLNEVLAAKGIDLSRRTQKTVRTTCRAQIYVDGIRGTYDPMSSAGDYQGIEFYSGPATAPEQFKANSACGVLLLWTRSR